MSSERIALAGETISRGDLEATARWLETFPQLTMGPETRAFEGEVAATVGSNEARFVNSGSSANLLAIAALKETGRLRNLVAVVPAVAWVTSVSPLTQLGFEVLVCDVDSVSLGIHVPSLERILEKRSPSVLVIVDVLGHANSTDEIGELCKQYDVAVVEDACEALGSIDAGDRHLGTFGTVGTYSFYFGHHLSTIEGGIVVTNDSEIAEIVTQLRSHGWARDLPTERQRELAASAGVTEFQSLYTFYRAGYNLRSTDLQAFIGRRQLPKLSSIAGHRERLFELYQELLPDYFVQTSSTKLVSAFAYGTLVGNPIETFEHLSRQGIESRPLIAGNIARHPFLRRNISRQEALPVADIVHEFGIYLPIHAGLSDSDVERVCDEFRSVAVPLADPTW